MSTADEEHKPSHTLGHVLMGLISGALAVVAVFLWFTDGDHRLSWPLSFAATSSVPSALAVQRPDARSSPRPDSPTRVIARRSQSAPSVAGFAPADPQSIETQAPAPSPSPLFNGVVDPQVASDAAATGMTARARPAAPANP